MVTTEENSAMTPNGGLETLVEPATGQGR